MVIKKHRCYKIDPKKIAKAPSHITPYLFLGAFYYDEEYEYFDLIKPYLDIPESPKSLKEIQQELNDKIDELIVKTKRQFAVSQSSADYRFKQFCDNQDYVFNHLKTYGCPPIIKYGISSASCGDIFVSLNSGEPTWQSGCTIINNDNISGYYYITSTFAVGLKEKPSKFFRFMSRILLNWKWKDA